MGLAPCGVAAQLKKSFPISSIIQLRPFDTTRRPELTGQTQGRTSPIDSEVASRGVILSKLM